MADSRNEFMLLFAMILPNNNRYKTKGACLLCINISVSILCHNQRSNHIKNIDHRSDALLLSNVMLSVEVNVQRLDLLCLCSCRPPGPSLPVAPRSHL